MEIGNGSERHGDIVAGRVRKAQSRVNVNTKSAIGHIRVAFADFAYNLVLIYAYGTLEHVLRDPKYEGNGLKRLMENSRADLPWVDYQKLEQGYMVRNKIAHEDLVVKRDRFGNM